MYQHQQIDDTSIIVDNFISLTHQAILSPEIIFFNKPITINNKKYLKLFINLNYNPNMISKENLNKRKTFEKFDFKLYSSTDLKEIKPLEKISSSLEIDNNKQDRINEIEYNIPFEYLTQNALQLSFGVSYSENNITYKGKGKIYFDTDFKSVEKNNFSQSLVSYFRNFNTKTGAFEYHSNDVISIRNTVSCKPVVVTKPADELIEIQTVFVEDIPSELVNNSRISEMIAQIKNYKIFPHTKIKDVVFKNLDDAKKYYKGSINLEIEQFDNDKLKIVNMSKFDLDEINKLVNITNSKNKSALFVNPYSWSDQQGLLIAIEHFGNMISIEIPFSTFVNYFSWNQSNAFVYEPSSITKYNFDQSFWAEISIIPDDDLREVLVKYEV